MGAKVENIFEYANRDMVKVLESLLILAKRGEVTGMIYATQLKSGKPAYGMLGTLAAQPTLALGVASRLWDRVHNVAAAREDEP